MSDTERVDRSALRILTRALSDAWTDLNATFFGGEMRPPTMEIRPLERQLGRWERMSRQIIISEALLQSQTWGVVLEVLKHEMVHQFVHEVLDLDETSHGPRFREECARIGIDSRARGLPRDPSPNEKRDKVLGRVQRLLALASSDNLHEAQAAMKAAQKLMLRFNIGSLESRLQPELGFLQLGRTLKRHPAHVKVLSGILGAHFFVRCIWVFAWDVRTARCGRVLEVCGTQANLEIAAYVHDFLLSAAERLWTEHKRDRDIRSNADRRRFLCGVLIGFSDSLEDASQVHQQTGLVWVGDPRVDDWLHQRHPRIRRGSARTIRVDGAWLAGRAAGRELVLHRPIAAKADGGKQRMLLG